MKAVQEAQGRLRDPSTPESDVALLAAIPTLSLAPEDEGAKKPVSPGMQAAG